MVKNKLVNIPFECNIKLHSFFYKKHINYLIMRPSILDNEITWVDVTLTPLTSTIFTPIPSILQLVKSIPFRLV